MDAFIGQIGIFGFNFAPRNWGFCNGTTLSISQNTALFSLIGTTYGGNGQTTFALPNLESRTPIAYGSVPIGAQAGQEFVTLTLATMPAHTHPFQVSNSLGNAVIISGGDDILAQGNTGPAPGSPAVAYAPPPHNVVLNAQSTSPSGGSQPHNNIQPSLAVNFCICLFGIFPSRN